MTASNDNKPKRAPRQMWRAGLLDIIIASGLIKAEASGYFENFYVGWAALGVAMFFGIVAAANMMEAMWRARK